MAFRQRKEPDITLQKGAKLLEPMISKIAGLVNVAGETSCGPPDSLFCMGLFITK